MKVRGRGYGQARVLRTVGPWLAVSVLVLGWFAYDIHRTSAAKEAARVSEETHDRSLKKAESERLRAATESRRPTTLSELRSIVGSDGWCGSDMRPGESAMRARWHYRASIPVGEVRVYGGEGELTSGDGVEAVVDGCDPQSKVLSLTLPASR